MSGIKNVTDGLAYHTNDTTLNTEAKLLNAQKAFLSSSSNSSDAQEFCLNAFNMAAGKNTDALKVESDLTGNPKNGLAFIGSNFAISQKNYLSQAQISSVAQNFCSNAFNMAAGVDVSESLAVKFITGISAPLRGRVIDGPISGCVVTQMQGGGNVTIGTTDSQGFYDLSLADTSAGAAPFVASGGTDTVTGITNTVTLKSTAAVISPATTVSVSIKEANPSLSIDEANELAASYLNISKEQVTSDNTCSLRSSTRQAPPRRPYA